MSNIDVEIVEVGPRDGLQNLDVVMPTVDKCRWIAAEHGVSRQDAYMLCSLAGDLKILEVVDAGMWNVGFTLPLSIFGD